MNFNRITVLTVLLCLMSLTLVFASDNDKDSRRKAADKIQKTSPARIKAMQKKANMRKPTTIPPQTIEKINNSRMNKDNSSLPKKKEDTQLSINTSLPNNMIFPGEYEEVKAILITWDYFTLDSNGNVPGEYVIIEPMFEGTGLYTDYTDYVNSGMSDPNLIKYSTGKVINILDTYDNMSDMPKVFSQLAHGIDQNAEVWINVWYPEDSTEIKQFMADRGMELKHAKFFVNQGNSFWYRDCGPQAFYYGSQDSIGFIDFEYYGGRPLDDVIPIKIGNKMGIPVFTNSIEYEGGNILLDGQGSLFTSNKVYSENGDNLGQYVRDTTKPLGFYQIMKAPLSASKVRDSLTKYLNLKKCNVLPSYVNDGGTGHIDLYADMWDETNFVFSQMPDVLKSWADYITGNKNIDTIMKLVKFNGSKYQKSFIPFPMKDDGSWYASTDDYDTLTRTYSNHVFVNKSIIQPVFASQGSGDYEQMQKDLEVIKAKYPGYNIIPIDVRSFDGSGGAIHCITKQIPADNPVRIYHVPLISQTTKSSKYTIIAQLQNMSGIQTGQCFWRYKGESGWKTIQLTSDVNGNYTGDIINTLDSGTVEYYISATSNNGKTMTKPITAPAGSYSFSFGITTDVAEETLNSKVGEFYPNPAIDNVEIMFNVRVGSFTITIADITGNIVYSNKVDDAENYNAISINTGSFAAGAYMVTFNFPDGTSARRKLMIIK